MRWLQNNAAVLQAIGALLQAFTAVLIVVLTRKLSDATREYVKLTRQSLEHSRELTRREWLPQVFPNLRTKMPDTWLDVYNVSKNGCIVDTIRLRLIDDHESKNYPVFLPVTAGSSSSAKINDVISEFIAERTKVAIWGGRISVAVSFKSADETHVTTEFRSFQMEYQTGVVLGVAAIARVGAEQKSGAQ
jgi:hypothetical protein